MDIERCPVGNEQQARCQVNDDQEIPPLTKNSGFLAQVMRVTDHLPKYTEGMNGPRVVA